MSDCVVGVDVGGTAVKAVAWAPGLDGQPREVLARWRWNTGAAEGADAVGARVLEVVSSAVERARDECGPVLAVGVGVPGVVDENSGVAVFSENLGWRDWPVRDLVAERIGLPTALGHDVRLGALAEARPPAPSDLVFVTVGTGVGSALVLDGRVRVGRRWCAGEIGHLVVDPNGPDCACGKAGCVEAIGSAAAIERRYRRAARVDVHVPAEEVIRRARSGDRTARRVWREAVDALAHGIAAAVAVVDPETVVVGGGLAAAGPHLFTPLRAALAPRLVGLGNPPVVAARLGSWAGAVGAAIHAWQQCDGRA